MLKNDLLLRVANGEKTERPPVWLMRQAGRILPQYRTLRAKFNNFKELVERPELASEITIQPVDELEVDAAILFSDILVVPQAMGLPYEMIKGKGPWFPKTIETLNDIDKLITGAEAAASLEYVYAALRLTKQELNNRVPLIGFAGAPFTILCYLIEGSGSKTFSKAKKLIYQHPEWAQRLLDKITETTIAYLQNKVVAGADLIQLFDSWAGVLTYDMFQKFALPYLRKIARALGEVPVILFARGAWHSIQSIAQSGNIVGLDWTIIAKDARQLLGTDQVVQGNLDPCYLYATTEELKKATVNMINAFGGSHIVNLGHGVYPDTSLDKVKVFVNTVKEYRYG